MDWANERYVRLYTRDSVTWRLWSWEARALLCLLLRAVDRAGVLDLGEHDPTTAVAAVVGMPPEVVARALPELVAHGTAELGQTTLVLPAYIAAQECTSSDRQRQRECRERRREGARSHAVTRGHTRSQNVTACDRIEDPVTRGHEVSQDVTPSRATPSLANLTLSDSSNESDSDSPSEKPDHDDIGVVWRYYCARRSAAIPGARPLRLTADRRRAIRALLRCGYTPEDVRAVVDAYAFQAQRDPSQRRWMNGTTEFRSANFGRVLGQLADTGGQLPGGALPPEVARWAAEAERA